MKQTTTTILALAGFLLFAHVSEAKTVRATDMNAALWSQVASGKADDVDIDFRQGDEIPVNLMAQGDLIETSRPEPTYVRVKRNFLLRITGHALLINLDGRFRDVRDVLTGSLQAGFEADQPGGPVNAFNIMFNARVK